MEPLTSNHLWIAAGILTLALFAIILIRRRKAKSKNTALFVPHDNFAHKIKTLFAGTPKVTRDIVPAVEEVLLTADVGITATEKLIHDVFENNTVVLLSDAYGLLKNLMTQILTPKTEFTIDTTKKPFVIYLVGVNGVGKTTTIGKLASQFKMQGLSVMMVAADTFRAAAVEQLRVWAERNQVLFTGGAQNADPSSVIVDGLRSAKAKAVDVVLVDTAGRLHTKSNLMAELKKMVRMSEKEIGRNPDEIFLVVDAITGQNGFSQAEIFLEAIPVSGIILTKYDATSKGGIIISIADQTGIPIRYVGLGEKIGDLRKFDAKEFVERLFAA